MTYACFQKSLRELKLTGKARLQASGIIVSKGLKPDPLALKVLRKKGITVNGYRIQPLSEVMLKKASVMIALSPEDFNYVKNAYKVMPPKVRILNIPVILGKRDESYETALARIQEGLEEELRSLKPRRS